MNRLIKHLIAPVAIFAIVFVVILAITPKTIVVKQSTMTQSGWNDILRAKEDRLSFDRIFAHTHQFERNEIEDELDLVLLTRSSSESLSEESISKSQKSIQDAAADPADDSKSVAIEPVKTVETSVQTQIATPVKTESFNSAVRRLVNSYREQNGLAAFTYEELIEKSAQIRAGEIARCPSHDRPDGNPFYTVFTDVGFVAKAGAENYAVATAGCFSAEEIVNSWIASPVHRANILNGDLTIMGIGRIVSGDQEIFVQIFAA